MSTAAPPSPGQVVSLEERPDYMLEAFLEEQNILIKPLFVRRLGLLAVLDLQAQVVQKQLKRALDVGVAPSTQKKPRGQTDIDRFQEQLLNLAEEKIAVTRQLQDVALRQMDTILEVESALESAARKERDENEAVVRISSSRSKGGANTTVPQFQEEVWCVCRGPDDGRPMVACDNSKCSLTWWHLDCVEGYMKSRGVGTMPEESGAWICPVCSVNSKSAKSTEIKAEIKNPMQSPKNTAQLIASSQHSRISLSAAHNVSPPTTRKSRLKHQSEH